MFCVVHGVVYVSVLLEVEVHTLYHIDKCDDFVVVPRLLFFIPLFVMVSRFTYSQILHSNIFASTRSFYGEQRSHPIKGPGGRENI